ncbi:MAG: hypothetical protein ACRDIY_06125 [Chloroflexota bacterium]
MNAIGIDYQQTLTAVWLREENEAGAHLRSIGDGLRSLIPNLAVDEGGWGSRAALAGESLDERSSAEGPWLAEPGAAVFWRCLYRRVTGYLGRVKPIPRNGYQVVVAIPSVGSAAGPTIERFGRDAGFDALRVIRTTDAVLARWLAEGATEEPRDRLVAVVAVGDTTTLVGAGRLGTDADGRPALHFPDDAVTIVPTGFQGWLTATLEAVQERLDQPLGVGSHLVMRDAAIAFGRRLSLASRDQTTAWSGPFHDEMFASLEVSPRDAESWPGAQELDQRIPEAIRRAVSVLGADRRPDLALVGGIGAAWPFARRAVGRVAPTWQSQDPIEDVARGAAWWPSLIATLAPLDRPSLSEPSANLLLPSGEGRENPPDDRAALPVTKAESSRGSAVPSDGAAEDAATAPSVPPWLRDGGHDGSH